MTASQAAFGEQQMKFPVIGGILFVVSGAVALAAVALLGGRSTTPVAATAPPSAVEIPEGAFVFSVPDMHCEFACAPKVRETLAGLPGVENVETNIEAHTATVFVTDGFDADQAVAALAEAGFTGTPLQ
jgi:mercuric ion binding protein